MGLIIVGDALEQLRDFPENHFHACVTDPPYGLSKEPDAAEVMQHWLNGDKYEHKASGFMGKSWDSFVPGPEYWREVYRVLRPGGHLLAFGGTRTADLLSIAIRLAGFSIRDTVCWLYGSGFPKSMAVDKAIDKAAGAEREITEVRERSSVRPVVPDQSGGKAYRLNGDASKTTPATDAAKQWAGWGTALKPANEPILLARKPLSERTVAENVLKWATGGLNIDGCRIGRYEDTTELKASGRFPANLVLSCSPYCTDQHDIECPSFMLDAQSGVSPSNTRRSKLGTQFSRFFYCAKPSKRERNAGLDGLPEKTPGEMTDRTEGSAGLNSPRAGAGRVSGGANFHPTVKPLALMRYLVKLIAPPGGLVLDPFAGSGSTGVAARDEGFEFVGIEMNPEYAEIARARITNWKGLE